MLLAMMYFGSTAKVVDVEKDFLYKEIEEEILMECPPGMESATKEHVLGLTEYIYGLVQAARQYYKYSWISLCKWGLKEVMWICAYLQERTKTELSLLQSQTLW